MDRLLIIVRRAGAGVLAVAAWMLVVAAPASAQGSATAGRTVFAANCAMCHMATSNGHSLIGPNLYGVVGRRAASVPGFAYSPAMQHANMTWTTAQIEAFVRAPGHVVPGTRMTFAGLRNPQQAADVVAYLNSLRSTSAH